MGLRKAGVWLGLVDQDDDVLILGEHSTHDTYAEEDQPADEVNVGIGVQIAVVRPRTFRDAAAIGEYFRQDIPVLINLGDLDNSDAKRIVDFASGLIFGRRGDIERLSRRIFMILPTGSTVLTEQAKVADEGFFNQA